MEERRRGGEEERRRREEEEWSRGEEEERRRGREEERRRGGEEERFASIHTGFKRLHVCAAGIYTVFKWYRLKPMQFQAGYVIQMLKPMHTATKDWREAGEERRRGGKEERRRGGEEERRRGGQSLTTHANSNDSIEFS